MKNYDAGPFRVGQKLLHCSGTNIHTVTFVSPGPRVGKGVKSAIDLFSDPPQTAIVRDQHENLLTVRLADLKPFPAS